MGRKVEVIRPFSKYIAASLLENLKIFAFCYTQLYDIERKAKFDPAIIKAINTKKVAIEE